MLVRRRLVYAFLSLLVSAGLAVADDATLVVTPDSLFFRQLTSTAPAPQKISLSAKGATLGSFTATATSTGNWLSISPASGSGATTITVTPNTTGLAPGEYSGSITISATGFIKPVTVKVQLEITPTTATGSSTPSSPTSVLILRPGDVEFRAAQGGAAPSSRDLVIFNPAGDAFSWTAAATVSTPAGGKWLSVSPASGSGKAVLKVQADPTGLNAAQYDGLITVTSSGNTATTRVRLNVDTAQSTHLIVVPQALNFNVEPNAKNPLRSRTLEVRGAGRPDNRGPGGGGPGGAPATSWTASTTIDKPAGGTWLTISPASGKTPGKITVKASPTGLAAGTYSGKVVVKSGADTTNVLVFLRVLGSSATTAIVSPRELRFTATTGTGGVVSPATRTVKINTTSTGLTFTATASTAKGGSWLKITPASGAVPGSITASVDAAIATKLAPGFYTGAIEVKIPGAAKPSSTVHVGLRVVSPDDKPRLEVEPAGVAFNATVGGSDPAAKQVELEPEGAASLAWTATATVATPTGGTWLSVSPTSGTTTAASPSKVNVAVKIAGLVAGTYSGTVVFTPDPASGAPAVHLKVTLIVAAAPATKTALAMDETGAAVAPGNLVAFFTSPGDGFVSDFAAPPVVSVTVLDSAGAPVEGATVKISSSNTEPDMTLEDIGGGEYQGVFRALSSGSLTLTGTAELDTQSSAGFGVSGDMEASADQPTIVFQNGAVSAASLAQGPVPLAPGSLVSLFGKNLAGDGGAAGSIPLTTTLGGVSVTIGGIPAPLLASLTAQDQINLQVPFELFGQSSADIVINNNGVLSQPETVDIGVAPALFTVSSSGTGAGAFLHGSGSALISPGSPASSGEVILLYATGLGTVAPSVDTGNATFGLSNVSGDVTVTIGGQNAPVEFAGLAPGFVGLYQINVRVPAGLTAGDALVVLSVDGTPATGEATLSIR